MLTLLTGKTGSGKSYKSVEEIIAALDKDRKVYTNIKVNYEDENYIYLDELAVKQFLFFIEKTFKEVTNLEAKKEEIRNPIYFESDFFIDEAHLVGFRDKKESILNWLTLHRHFNQNVTVITQIPSNIHRDYLALFHSHLDMLPPNKRISKGTMGVRQFDAYKGDRLGTKYFKPKPELFEIYNSGNVETGINQEVFKLMAVLGGISALVILVWFSSTSFFDSVSTPKDFVENENNKTKTIVSQNGSIENNETNVTIPKYSFFCDTKEGCYIDGKKYSLSEFLMVHMQKFKEIRQQVVLSNDDYQMIKFTLPHYMPI